MKLFLTLVILLTSLTLIIPLAGAAAILSKEKGVGVHAPFAPEKPTVSTSAPPAVPPDFSSSKSSPAVPFGKKREDSTFSILNLSTGKVERVAVLDYIRGAVASEMPPSFHPQALAAQALAAHTRGVYCAGLAKSSPDPDLRGADFAADPSKREGYITESMAREVYGANFDILWPAICKAADYAAARLITYEGEAILAAYHAASAGITEDCGNVWLTSLPYLISVESEGDVFAPDFKVETHFTKANLEKLLTDSFGHLKLMDGEEESWITPLEYSNSGYILLADVGGLEVSGRELREALALRSSCLEINYSNGVFTIQSKGYGHGVGLSQYGADFMARQGADADKILKHYYQGCEVTLL